MKEWGLPLLLLVGFFVVFPCVQILRANKIVTVLRSDEAEFVIERPLYFWQRLALIFGLATYFSVVVLTLVFNVEKRLRGDD